MLDTKWSGVFQRLCWVTSVLGCTLHLLGDIFSGCNVASPLDVLAAYHRTHDRLWGNSSFSRNKALSKGSKQMLDCQKDGFSLHLVATAGTHSPRSLSLVSNSERCLGGMILKIPPSVLFQDATKPCPPQSPPATSKEFEKGSGSSFTHDGIWEK